MGATSEHFSEEELRCPCCGVNGMKPEPLDLAERIRAKAEGIYGMGRVRVAVISAFRCEKHNKVVGGAPKSQHPQGQALDAAILVLQDRGKNKTEWGRLSAADAEAIVLPMKGLGGFGRRDSTGMFHFDTRPRISGPPALWCYDPKGKQVPYYKFQAVTSGPSGSGQTTART